MADECTAFSAYDGVEKESDYIPVQLAEALSIRDVCSEAGAVFEISEDQNASKKHGQNEENFFDDDELINSLRLGAGNAMFDEVSCSDDESEPFEKLAEKMEDMTGDGGVLKMEVHPGIGGNIPSKATVIFHYSACLEFVDEPFDSSFFRKKPEKNVLDSGDMLPGLNIAIKTMRKDERARFLVKSQYAFGEIGCPPRIPGNETILYDIHVVNFIDCAAADAFDDLDEKEQNTASFQEKLDAAHGFRFKGNEHYHEGNLIAAKNAYSRAAWIMEDVHLKDEEEEAQRGALLVKMRSNLAQVYIDLKEPARACSQCKKALDVTRIQSDDIIAKIHFRFGKAKQMLCDFKGARKEFLCAQRLRPNNTDISKALELLLQKEQKYEAQEQFMYKQMFKSFECTSSEDQGKSTKLEESKNQKGVDHGNILPRVKPEFKHVVEETILHFASDPGISELPFPHNLSQAEIAFVAAAAKAANCTISVKQKGTDTLLKVLKKR